MSRHTPLDKPISRSLPAKLDDHDDSELVINLEPGGIIRLTAEPVSRRLGRGEKLPEVKLDAVKLFNELSGKKDSPGGLEGLKNADLEKNVQEVLTKLAIAYDEGDKSL